MLDLLKPTLFKYEKVIRQFYYVLLASTCLITIYKDVSYAVPLSADLRNRVVGARMLKDGLSPYYYTSSLGQPIRYYGIFNSGYTVSTATASPFFHWLFSLVADMPQLQIDILWMMIQYLCLAGCFHLTLSALPKQYHKNAIALLLTVVVIFTFTTGWRINTCLGQNYIFIPLLALWCFYFINKGKSSTNIFFFAIFATSLILIRPVAILILLPFAFFAKTYLKWGLATLLTIAVYIIFVLFSPVQKKNWVEYYTSVQDHININQGLVPIPLKGSSDTFKIKHFEGVDMDWGDSQKQVDNLLKRSQGSNLYFFYTRITKKELSINAMTYCGIITSILILLPLVWFIKKKQNLEPIKLFLIGFVVYDIFTFCSPIIRGHYYWVEFLLPLLLIAAWMRKLYIIPVCFLVLGLLFNLPLHIGIPSKENIGEFLIVISLLHHVYRPIFVSCFSGKNWKAKRTINLF